MRLHSKQSYLVLSDRAITLINIQHSISTTYSLKRKLHVDFHHICGRARRAVKIFNEYEEPLIEIHGSEIKKNYYFRLH